MASTYKLRLFDSRGQWFSTKTVQDFEANGANVNNAIDSEFKYWQPGTVSAIAIDDDMGQVRRVTYLQWSRGRNESTAAKLVDQMLSEEFATNPHYTTNTGVKGGDSHVFATATKAEGGAKKEGDEYQQTGEERREIAIADRLLKAAQNMARTPDVEEVIRLATELKKMHGV